MNTDTQALSIGVKNNIHFSELAEKQNNDFNFALKTIPEDSVLQMEETKTELEKIEKRRSRIKNI